MKTILNISIAGMVAAGIYGFADFAKDLHNGTLIKYDDGTTIIKKDNPTAATKEIKVVNDKVEKVSVKATTKQIAQKTKAAPVEKKKEESGIDMSKMKLRYFSRGRPPMVEDEIVEDDSAVVVPTETESSIKKPESDPSSPK